MQGGGPLPGGVQHTAVLNEEQGHNVIVFVASELTHGQMLLCGWAEGFIWEQRDKAEVLLVGALRCEMSQDCGASIAHSLAGLDPPPTGRLVKESTWQICAGKDGFVHRAQAPWYRSLVCFGGAPQVVVLALSALRHQDLRVGNMV